MLSSATRRRLKYSLGADIIHLLVRFTPFLNGSNTRPPDVINFAGSGGFEENGDITVSLMRQYAGLKDGDHVLDIGSAIARNALAIHREMGARISYEGFDIVRYGIVWSRKCFAKISDRYNFKHADVWNSFYNPRGKIDPQNFTFPYPDNHFDISVSTSVYTHMRKAAMAHYMSETARVTKLGGRAYFTIFGYDGVNDKSNFSFQHAGDGDWVEDPTEPAMAVAQDMDWLTAYLTELGASRVEIVNGYWRGEAGPDFQDVIIAHF